MWALMPWLRVIGYDAWVALGVIEALFYGLMGLAWAATSTRRWWPVAAAASWVGAELLRGTVPFGGLPWGRLAFGLVDTPFDRYGRLGGTALVSFLAVLVVTLLVSVGLDLVSLLRRRTTASADPESADSADSAYSSRPAWRSWPSAAAAKVVVALVIVLVSLVLNRSAWPERRAPSPWPRSRATSKASACTRSRIGCRCCATTSRRPSGWHERSLPALGRSPTSSSGPRAAATSTRSRRPPPGTRSRGRFARSACRSWSVRWSTGRTSSTCRTWASSGHHAPDRVRSTSSGTRRRSASTSRCGGMPGGFVSGQPGAGRLAPGNRGRPAVDDPVGRPGDGGPPSVSRSLTTGLPGGIVDGAAQLIGAHEQRGLRRPLGQSAQQFAISRYGRSKVAGQVRIRVHGRDQRHHHDGTGRSSRNGPSHAMVLRRAVTLATGPDARHQVRWLAGHRLRSTRPGPRARRRLGHSSSNGRMAR